VTEGNYLLLDRREWRAVRSQLDVVWFLRCEEEVRRSRLVARHIEFGKSPEDAERWVSRVDDVNAALVAATAQSADRIVSA
jgi:pantothenate kinase